MKTIMLYGFLGKQFGRVHRYDVVSPAEAIQALVITLKGFKKALVDGGSYKVLVGGKESLERDHLGFPVSDRESIRIVPVVAGSSNPITRIIIGAALIWFAAPLAGAMGATAGTATAAGTAGFMGVTAGTFAAIGTSLIIGGVSQILFSPKSAETTERPENRPSYAFDGAINTSAQGNPVSILYGGPLIVGSQVISAGLSVDQI